MSGFEIGEVVATRRFSDGAEFLGRLIANVDGHWRLADRRGVVWNRATAEIWLVPPSDPRLAQFPASTGVAIDAELRKLSDRALDKLGEGVCTSVEIARAQGAAEACRQRAVLSRDEGPRAARRRAVGTELRVGGARVAHPWPGAGGGDVSRADVDETALAVDEIEDSLVGAARLVDRRVLNPLCAARELEDSDLPAAPPPRPAPPSPPSPAAHALADAARAMRQISPRARVIDRRDPGGVRTAELMGDPTPEQRAHGGDAGRRAEPQLRRARELRAMSAGSNGYCQLCGAEARIAVAMLRVAWEARTVPVRACPSCSAVAWRTVEELRAETYRAMREGMPSPASLGRVALRRLIAPSPVMPPLGRLAAEAAMRPPS